jgi:hypothetical protein
LNLNEHVNAYQGGFFGSRDGRSRYQEMPKDATMVHELFHHFQDVTQTKSVDSRARELDAWSFENAYRREAGLPSRDCYFKCNPRDLEDGDDPTP